MTVTAAIAFTQGSNISAPGVALLGVANVLLVVSNGDNTNVVEWKFELVDVSSLSALTIGVKQDGATSTYSFTPDSAGGFLLHLTVFDSLGNFSEDFREFQVPEASGRIIPSFKATDRSLNFFIGGVQNLRGWSPFMEAYLRHFDNQAVLIGNWQTALDLDLTAQGSQNFFTDGVYSLAGMTWHKVRSLGDANTALVNGQGLVFQPVITNSAPPIAAGLSGTFPQMWFAMTQIAALASMGPDWPLRVSVHLTMSSPTAVAGAIQMVPASIFVPAAGAFFLTSKAPTNSFNSQVSSTGVLNSASFADATEYANDNVIMLELPDGIDGRANAIVGTYSSGWPANSSLLVAVANFGVIATAYGNGGRMSNWGFSIGGWRVTGTPSVTFAHLRVEYQPR